MTAVAADAKQIVAARQQNVMRIAKNVPAVKKKITKVLSPEEIAALPASPDPFPSPEEPPTPAPSPVPVIEETESTTDENQTTDNSITDDELEKLVLTTFGTTIVGSFFNILADPHNVVNVTTQIGNMFNGIMQIIIHAFKKGELTSESSDEEVTHYIEKVRFSVAKTIHKNKKFQELLEDIEAMEETELA